LSPLSCTRSVNQHVLTEGAKVIPAFSLPLKSCDARILGNPSFTYWDDFRRPFYSPLPRSPLRRRLSISGASEEVSIRVPPDTRSSVPLGYLGRRDLFFLPCERIFLPSPSSENVTFFCSCPLINRMSVRRVPHAPLIKECRPSLRLASNRANFTSV